MINLLRADKSGSKVILILRSALAFPAGQNTTPSIDSIRFGSLNMVAGIAYGMMLPEGVQGSPVFQLCFSAGIVLKPGVGSA